MKDILLIPVVIIFVSITIFPFATIRTETVEICRQKRSKQVLSDTQSLKLMEKT